MNIIETAGALTDTDNPPLDMFARRGWKWCAWQVQNDYIVKAYDLEPARRAGLSPGVWGVTYRPEEFHRDGKALGQLAVSLGAAHVQMDIEEAAKGTRVDRGLKPVVVGIREGGWNGPVHLNTMGAPDSPDTSDYEIDIASFLETGGGVISQDYFNESDSFSPLKGVRYWTRVGVPRSRYNSMIGSHASASDKRKPNFRMSGAEWLPLLIAAGITANVSYFMAEWVTDADLAALEVIVKAPPPPAVPTATRTRLDMLSYGKAMERFWTTQRVPPLTTLQLQSQRIAVANAVLEMTDQEWQILQAMSAWPEIRRLLFS